MIGTIWKFKLTIGMRTDLNMPPPSTVLSVGIDGNGDLCLWAIVDPHNQTEQGRRTFTVRPTGMVDTDFARLNFIGTAIDAREGFVWHVFEVVS